MYLFVDDAIIYLLGNNFDDMVLQVNEDLQFSFSYLNCNSTAINTKNSKYMVCENNNRNKWRWLMFYKNYKKIYLNSIFNWQLEN